MTSQNQHVAHLPASVLPFCGVAPVTRIGDLREETAPQSDHVITAAAEAASSHVSKPTPR